MTTVTTNPSAETSAAGPIPAPPPPSTPPIGSTNPAATPVSLADDTVSGLREGPSDSPRIPTNDPRVRESFAGGTEATGVG